MISKTEVVVALFVVAFAMFSLGYYAGGFTMEKIITEYNVSELAEQYEFGLDEGFRNGYMNGAMLASQHMSDLIDYCTTNDIIRTEIDNGDNWNMTCVAEADEAFFAKANEPASCLIETG